MPRRGDARRLPGRMSCGWPTVCACLPASQQYAVGGTGISRRQLQVQASVAIKRDGGGARTMQAREDRLFGSIMETQHPKRPGRHA